MYTVYKSLYRYIYIYIGTYLHQITSITITGQEVWARLQAKREVREVKSEAWTSTGKPWDPLGFCGILLFFDVCFFGISL